ncbi:pantoate--beta-alanine ligase [Marinobacterium zhoushanense]|uniref:pantoate--beta-alanine ligase n=1 Tax=Marinobacterium zhoushanense TaxID=1679163 RepID=UPI00166B9328
MQTLTTIAELRSRLNAERASGKRIALVPTMGNLHQGHLRLVETAVANADFVVASIFVNPLQFGPNEDLERYPRTLAEDQAQLEAFGCNLLFAPTEAEVYPQGRAGQTFVEVPGISDLYCGASRPGHFRGVTTIVNKLFNLIQPDVAVFGCKDYQQLHVIRRMVDDLSMPVELIGVSTERAANGLALSSRNGYLTEDELAIAPALYAALCDLRAALKGGDTNHERLIEHAQQHLERNGFMRDYIHILRRSDMLAATAADRELVIIAAAYLGAARLIDNIEVDL